MADRLALGLLKARLHKMGYGTDCVVMTHTKNRPEKNQPVVNRKLRVRVAETRSGDQGRERVMEISCLGILRVLRWLVYLSSSGCPGIFHPVSSQSRWQSVWTI